MQYNSLVSSFIFNMLDLYIKCDFHLGFKRKLCSIQSHSPQIKINKYAMSVFVLKLTFSDSFE